MRFILDHDVDVAVGVVLRRLGHEAWSAGSAGLALVADDALTVYADEQGAALITHDKEFSQRRKHNVIGKHVWLRCSEIDAPALVEKRIDEIIAALAIRDDIWVRVSQDGMDTSFAWE